MIKLDDSNVRRWVAEAQANVAVRQEALKHMNAVKDVIKSFDGKVINVRLTKAIMTATKGNVDLKLQNTSYDQVSICVRAQNVLQYDYDTRDIPVTYGSVLVRNERLDAHKVIDILDKWVKDTSEYIYSRRELIEHLPEYVAKFNEIETEFFNQLRTSGIPEPFNEIEKYKYFYEQQTDKLFMF